MGAGSGGQTADVAQLGNEPTPEAHGDGVGSAARLQLGEEVSDVRLDRLLRQEQPLSDLAIDESVGDQLQNLEFPCRGLLFELAQSRRCERDHGAGTTRVPTRGGCLEPAAVIAVPVQDLFTLSGVHRRGYRPPADRALEGWVARSGEAARQHVPSQRARPAVSGPRRGVVPMSSSGGEAGEIAQRGEARQCLALELPHALPREVELVTDRLERPRLALEPETQLEDPALTLR